MRMNAWWNLRSSNSSKAKQNSEQSKISSALESRAYSSSALESLLRILLHKAYISQNSLFSPQEQIFQWPLEPSVCMWPWSWIYCAKSRGQHTQLPPLRFVFGALSMNFSMKQYHTVQIIIPFSERAIVSLGTINIMNNNSLSFYCWAINISTPSPSCQLKALLKEDCVFMSCLAALGCSDSPCLSV